MVLVNANFKQRSHFYSTTYKKSKSDWNGSSPADAFRPNLPSSYQLAPRKKLWQLCQVEQSKVVQYFHGEAIRVKPQVAHFYLLPPVLAALSCIGLTTFLEAKEHAQTKEGLIETYNASFIKSPQVHLHSDLPLETLQKLARMTAKVIDNRMIIQLVHTTLGCEYVEMYRAISSSLIDLDSIHSLEQCITLNLIYGDLLLNPKSSRKSLYQLWSDLRKFNQPYLDSFKQLDDSKLLSAAAEWHLKLTQKIVTYFSQHEASKMKSQGKEPLVIVDAGSAGDAAESRTISITNADITVMQRFSGFMPIDQDGHKEIFNSLDEESRQLLKDLVNSVDQAGRDANTFGSGTYNILLDEVRKDLWSKTPVEGTPGEGRDVNLDFLGYQMSDVVYDQALPLSYDFDSIGKIKAYSAPITAQLRRILYVSPSFASDMMIASSGANFNGASLPTYQVSDNLFSRNRDFVSFTNQGQSIVVLAADTSSSNSKDQIDCVKILSGSWIGAAKSNRNQIEFLGATYDSGNSGGHSGTMVRWIYNERFNESRTFEHALHRVDSIVPNGGNSDIKSWCRIMQEVDGITQNKPRLRKAHIYLILISDCAFNKSFSNTPLTAATEVQEYLKSLKTKTYKERLHITLVSLSNGTSALDHLVDLKLTIANNEMKSPGQSAQQISGFVSQAIKQQRAKLKAS